MATVGRGRGGSGGDGAVVGDEAEEAFGLGTEGEVVVLGDGDVGGGDGFGGVGELGLGEGGGEEEREGGEEMAHRRVPSEKQLL